MASEDDIVAGLGAPDEFGQLALCFRYGDFHWNGLEVIVQATYSGPSGGPLQQADLYSRRPRTIRRQVIFRAFFIVLGIGVLATAAVAEVRLLDKVSQS
ncbi:MAG: hypothetical protein OXH70_11295 [Acidobacteria bacterium]|nr:hypothetical protein [Acidobacteriota bacterium]